MHGTVLEMGSIYKLTSPKGKVYVGQCKRTHRVSKKSMSPLKMLKMRWQEHCRGSSGCVAIKKAINKYGRHRFSSEVLIEVSDELLDHYERKFIAMYDSGKSRFGYNRTSGGEGGGFAIPRVRRKMLQKGSKWMLAQQSEATTALKQQALSNAKAMDPSIEERRRRNAKAACQTTRYREKHSSIQKKAQNNPATIAKRKAMLAAKRETMLEALPPVEREKKRRKLEKQAEATARWKAKQLTAN